MANQQQLKVLRQGVAVWNVWKREHPEISVDLYRANLYRANLKEADLSFVNLSGANLYKANLTKADLTGAHLTSAHLIGTNLSRSNLIRANLYRANLTGAHLTEAHLTEAFFHDADFTDADLSRATIERTTFGDIDLRTVKGLETIKHLGPSTIGIDTVLRSQGNIPETFLRGTGATDTFIDYVHSLTQKPIEYYTCFISYSTNDQKFAERLYADLQNKGVRCWFAPEDMKIGDKIRHRIDESIHLYDKLLLVLSEHSVKSQWVEHEVEMALAKERQENRTVLFPIRLDEAIIEINQDGWPSEVKHTRHIGDFTRWKQHDDYQQALERLLRDLKAEA